ncbi:carotenoid ester lipase precursor [Gloeopeniophorella convolvens]|nr:carotenoid ester lipase precursor [Gloeopeniophorella convolvens]
MQPELLKGNLIKGVKRTTTCIFWLPCEFNVHGTPQAFHTSATQRDINKPAVPFWFLAPSPTASGTSVMLTKHKALIFLVAQALCASAFPADPFVVQDPNRPAPSSLICESTETASTSSLGPAEVQLDDAVFRGVQKGATDQFLGIPFAQPPTGDLRLRRPQPLSPYEGLYIAQKFGKSCPQQRLILPNGLDSRLVADVSSVVGIMYADITPDDEDCLTLNVVRPSNVDSKSKLPVVVWIFGGGYQIGGSSTYDGGNIVSRSIDLKQPVIFVSINYRLSALGFMGGKEVKKEGVGNLGLWDQRIALQWVQTYISEFGGDPTKVTVWGESAGALSIAMHMVSNKGDQQGLFRGAIMQSGGPIPVGDIELGQRWHDFMVEKTGCSGANDSLACLRKVPYTTFKYAMDMSNSFFAYSGIALAWLPRVDGAFLTESPQHAVLRGHVSKIPVITGNCDDEGTLFALSSLNISTTKDLKTYISTYLLPTATSDELDVLFKYYPDDQRAGAPFDTGLKNALSAQFKRLAAVAGDFMFHAPRRLYLQYRADKQDSWAFISKRMKDTPFIGSAHATDLLNSFGVGELRDYVIRFTNNLDPNGDVGLGIKWPKWNPKKPQAIVFQESSIFPIVLVDDNYRTDPISLVVNMSLTHLI